MAPDDPLIGLITMNTSQDERIPDSALETGKIDALIVNNEGDDLHNQSIASRFVSSKENGGVTRLEQDDPGDPAERMAQAQQIDLDQRISEQKHPGQKNPEVTNSGSDTNRHRTNVAPIEEDELSDFERNLTQDLLLNSRIDNMQTAKRGSRLRNRQALS